MKEINKADTENVYEVAKAKGVWLLMLKVVNGIQVTFAYKSERYVLLIPLDNLGPEVTDTSTYIKNKIIEQINIIAPEA